MGKVFEIKGKKFEEGTLVLVEVLDNGIEIVADGKTLGDSPFVLTVVGYVWDVIDKAGQKYLVQSMMSDGQPFAWSMLDKIIKCVELGELEV